MEVRVKEVVKCGSEVAHYIEVDLSPLDWENILKGRYPSRPEIVNGKPYTISVGLTR